YVESAIASILGQTLVDLELIIFDNASTDGTEGICRRLAREDDRVRYARNARNLGAAANYNLVFKRSRAPYFKWAAHDDLLEPTFLERCVDVLDTTREDVVLAFPQSVIISADGTPLDFLPENPALRFEERLDLRMMNPHERLRQLVLQMSMCHPVFGVIRSEALARTRLIDRFHSSDVVLLTELALQGRFWEVHEPLFLRRLHPEMSMWDKTPEEVATWFDPDRQPRLVMRHTRLFAEQIRSVCAAGLPRAEKLRCLRVLLTDQLALKRRPMLEEWMTAGRRTFTPWRDPAPGGGAARSTSSDRLQVS
ncbi:MAG: glycosyltransferase family 2 protein, partial [Planctomycetota bacterium]